MLVSPTRNKDIETYTEILYITECVIRLFQRTQNKDLELGLFELEKTLGNLKDKIEHHDYTPEDEQMLRVEESIKKLFND